MRVDAFLCDAATVREGLLHVLGGGITRLWRTPFPALLGIDLAMLVTMESGEDGKRHVLQIRITGEDGQPIANVDGEMGIDKTEHYRPGEDALLSIVVPLGTIPLPAPGAYQVTVLVNQMKRAGFSFYADLNQPPATEDSRDDV